MRAPALPLRAPANRRPLCESQCLCELHASAANCRVAYRQLQTRIRSCLLDLATQGHNRRKTATQSLRSDGARAQDSGVAGASFSTKRPSSFFDYSSSFHSSCQPCDGTARAVRVTKQETRSNAIELGKPVERRGRKASGLLDPSPMTAGLPHAIRMVPAMRSTCDRSASRTRTVVAAHRFQNTAARSMPVCRPDRVCASKPSARSDALRQCGFSKHRCSHAASPAGLSSQRRRAGLLLMARRSRRM